MKRLKAIMTGRRVGITLYYLFLIITVGMFLLFVPLRTKLKNDEEITHRETNSMATGERELELPGGHILDQRWVRDVDQISLRALNTF